MITDTFLGLFLLNWNNGTFQREPLKSISVWAGSCYFRSCCSKTRREKTPVSVLQVLTQGLTDWDRLTLTPAAAGPALPHVFRDLCNLPAPPEQQEMAQGCQQLSWGTAAFALLLTKHSQGSSSIPPEDCYCKDKAVCISTAKLLPSLTSFTPHFISWFGRVSCIRSM